MDDQRWVPNHHIDSRGRARHVDSEDLPRAQQDAAVEANLIIKRLMLEQQAQRRMANARTSHHQHPILLRPGAQEAG